MSYHIFQVNEWVIHRDHLDAFLLAGSSAYQTSNATKTEIYIKLKDVYLQKYEEVLGKILRPAGQRFASVCNQYLDV